MNYIYILVIVTLAAKEAFSYDSIPSLLNCRTTKLDTIPEYLSDIDSTYNAIEKFQSLYTDKNYVLKRTGEKYFTKKNAYKLLKEMHSITGIPGDDNDTVILDIYKQYIPGLYPTRYQDPYQYLIFSPLIETIHSTAKSLDPRRDYIPKYGTFYTNTIIAERKRSKKDYLLLIHSKYLVYCLQMGKVALQVYKDPNLFYQCFRVNPDNLTISKIIKKDKQIPLNFFYTFSEFHYNAFPPNDSLLIKNVTWLQQECIQKAIQYWNNASETFLIGHEYTHAFMNHNYGNDSDFQSDTTRLKAWFNEIEADSLSQEILSAITLKNKNYNYNVGWNKYLLHGGLFYLNTLKYFEDGQSLLETDKLIPTPNQNDLEIILDILKNKNDISGNLIKFKKINPFFQNQDHPPIEARILLIKLQINKLINTNLYESMDANKLDNESKRLAEIALFSLDKMRDLTKKAYHNSYLHRDILNKTFNK